MCLYKSCSVLRKRTLKSSTLIAGSLTPLDLSSTLVSVFCWMSEQGQDQRPSINSGRLSISTPMSRAPAERLSLLREPVQRTCSTHWSQLRTLSTRWYVVVTATYDNNSFLATNFIRLTLTLLFVPPPNRTISWTNHWNRSSDTSQCYQGRSRRIATRHF